MIIKKLYLEVKVHSVIKDTLLQQDLEIGTRGVEWLFIEITTTNGYLQE